MLQRAARYERRRQLRAPCRRIRSHNCCQPLATWAIKQGTHGIQKREIGFAGAVLFDAASARDKQSGVACARASQELVRQRSLADAWFTGNKNDSARAGDS